MNCLALGISWQSTKVQIKTKICNQFDVFLLFWCHVRSRKCPFKDFFLKYIAVVLQCFHCFLFLYLCRFSIYIHRCLNICVSHYALNYFQIGFIFAKSSAKCMPDMMAWVDSFFAIRTEIFINQAWSILLSKEFMKPTMPKKLLRQNGNPDVPYWFHISHVIISGIHFALDFAKMKPIWK